MARVKRYDSEWKEVKFINGHAVFMMYVSFTIRGLGVLAGGWSTVVLLGGFVSMIDKQDFWNLTVITLVQTLWIDDAFLQRLDSAYDLFIKSVKEVGNLLTGNLQLANSTAHAEHPEVPTVGQVVAAIRVVGLVVGWVLAVAKNVLLWSSILGTTIFLIYGLYITAWVSIRGVMHPSYYGQADTEKRNLDRAHTVLYVMCLAQFSLILYRIMLAQQAKKMVKEVSQAYGFQDGGHVVFGYFVEITKGCMKNPSSAGERNLVTHALELMDSKSPSSDSFISGTLILDRILTRQHSDKIAKATNLIEQQEEKQQQLMDLEEHTPPSMKREKRKMKEEESNKKRQQQQQTEQEIIIQQRSVIKRLMGSESSTQILQELLETLHPRHSYDKKLREAAARIVEHVAGGIRLEQFPEGIQCISSLINTFEEYRQLQSNLSTSSSSSSSSFETKSEYSGSDSDSDRPHSMKHVVLSRIRWRTATTSSRSDTDNGMDQSSSSKANSSKSNPFRAYKELVLTGLRILQRLPATEDNCIIIISTPNLVSKIMAPVYNDLVHHTHHSAWSIEILEVSLRVILRIVTVEGEAGARLRQLISIQDKAIASLESIVRCEEGCIRGELQMNAMQILAQLCIDETAIRGNLTKMLISIFVNGDSSDGSIRKAAGKSLAVLFLSSKSIVTVLSKEENDRFVCDLSQILVQVGDDDTCRESAAEILEHLCIQCTENEQYFSTLKDAMTSLMPMVLREILYGLTGEEGNPRYARSGTDVESQVTTYNDKNSNCTSSSRGRNQHHMLHVALLSLCVTACDKLNLDLDTILLGGGDQVEYVAFSLAMKMVHINRDLITTDNLKVMKLITRMIIAAMKKLRDHGTVYKRDDLQNLMDTLSSISETMLDLEGCMVFATRRTTLPATANTFDSLVKQARELYGEIKDQDSEIGPAS